MMLVYQRSRPFYMRNRQQVELISHYGLSHIAYQYQHGKRSENGLDFDKFRWQYRHRLYQPEPLRLQFYLNAEYGNLQNYYYDRQEYKNYHLCSQTEHSYSQYYALRLQYIVAKLT